MTIRKIQRFYFQQQYSEPSSYDIPIDSPARDNWQIDFSPDRIMAVLKNLKPNKAMGPENINGKILKNCSRSLSFSLLFNMSYSSACLDKA